MIIDVVTLFGPSGGHPSDQAIVEEGGHEHLVYCAQRMNKVLKKIGGGSPPAWADVREVLRNRGGLAVSTTKTGLSIEVVPGPDYDPPRDGLLLSLNGSASFVPIAQEAVVNVGDHLLLPVNAEAESRLRQLDELLMYLPSDRRHVILNSIRRPSIDWRLTQIENQLHDLQPSRGGSSPQERQSLWAALSSRRKDWIMIGLPSVAAVVLLAVLLVYGPLGGSEWFSGENSLSTQNPGSTTGAAGTQSPSKAERPPDAGPPPSPSTTASQADYDRAVEDLIDALANRPSGRLAKLYRTHIEQGNQSRVNASALAWTVLKVVLVKTMPAQKLSENHPALEGPTELSATADLMKLAWQTEPSASADLRIRSMSDSYRQMLAVVSCDAWAAPMVPTEPRISFETEPCLIVLKKREVAAAEIGGLAKWVRSLP